MSTIETPAQPQKEASVAPPADVFPDVSFEAKEEAPPRPPAPPVKKRRPILLIIAGIIGAIIAIAICLVGASALFGSRQTDDQSLQASATQDLTSITTVLPGETTAAGLTTATSPDTGGLPTVDYSGIHFSYNPTLANSVNPETIEAQTSPDSPAWEVAPEHERFTFNGYLLYPEAVHTPTIYVYPVDEFIAANPTAAETITQLQDFLTRKPKTLNQDETIPALPLFNATQLLQARIGYLNFQNGNGVRFLTQYGQDLYPINNTGLFYSFQGLTNDNRYYIAAVLPVSTAILPDPSTITLDDNFYNNFKFYVQDIELKLNPLPASNFSPNMDLLDGMIRSFLINPE